MMLPTTAIPIRRRGLVNHVLRVHAVSARRLLASGQTAVAISGCESGDPVTTGCHWEDRHFIAFALPPHPRGHVFSLRDFAFMPHGCAI
jgi:hypothetical protein